MYFPILTAKQNEIFALNELPETVYSSTIPVLIPLIVNHLNLRS